MIYTLDFVILRYAHEVDELQVLLLKRDKEPFNGEYALPGGWIFEDKDKSLDDAFLRIVKDKVRNPMSHFEQVETVGSASRDPRGWSTTTVYLAFMQDPDLVLNKDMKWLSLDSEEAASLPFDHTDLLNRAMKRLLSKSQYSSLPVFLTGERFTLGFLEKVFEKVFGGSINTSAFRKRIEKTQYIVPTDDHERVVGRRPSRYFERSKDAEPEFYERLMTKIV